jgi:CRP/FNR family cyclic AMP-dependent transcriptional regulator
MLCRALNELDPAMSPHPQIDLLARLPEAERTRLLQIGQTQRFQKTEFVFHAGDATHHVYLLLTGRVKIYQPSTVGKEVILWFCFNGELFGLAEATRGGERVVSAQACDESDILCIRQEHFTDFLLHHPQTALLIVQVLSCRLRVLGDVVINLVSDDVRTRVLKMLMQLGVRCGTPHALGLRLNLPLTHQEIADMIGTTRQTVTTVLGQLEREAMIKTDRHMIYIVNQKLLGRMPIITASLPG